MFIGVRRGLFRAVDIAALIVLLFAPRGARATDTHEAFDLGVTNYEVYAVLDHPASRSLTLDAVVGAGLTSWLGVYAGVAATAALSRGEAETVGTLGLAATFNTAHFDVDGFLAMQMGPEGATALPAVEINLDTDDDLTGIGAYFRATALLTPSASLPQVAQGIHPVLGGYLSLRPGTQVLLEVGAPLDRRAGHWTPSPFVLLGLNHMLNPLLEAQAHVTTSPSASGTALQLHLGFVGTFQPPFF